MCYFHVVWLSICCRFSFLPVWNQLCSVNSDVQNLSLFYDAVWLNFILESFIAYSFPLLVFRQSDDLTFMAFLGLWGNASCLVGSPWWPWALSLALLCWDAVIFALGSRCEKVSEDAMPTLGCWHRVPLIEMSLSVMGWLAKPLNSLVAVPLSKNLLTRVQGKNAIQAYGNDSRCWNAVCVQ